ncbi:MAG: biopolymer transporter ExbD [Puniceicoccales bacterium]|jgi:biopolymer transport protein ExbD|nr:biopolymer transporter ExbD [Puniceicoccales bacterium]
MAGGGGGEGEPEFQVAPMVDVLLVLLIFFMTTATAQVLKIDKGINLPVTPHGQKQEDKAAAGLINVAYDPSGTPRFKLDDIEILDTDSENPLVKGSQQPLIEILKQRKGNNEKFRLLIRADRKIQAKFLAKVLGWGAEAGIDNIAFSGVNIDKQS